MSDLPANSKKAKEDVAKAAPRVTSANNPLEVSKKPVEKETPAAVATGSVKEVKESAFRRFKNNFFGSDVNSVMGYITTEVLLPALKDLIVDTTSKGMERMMYGEVRTNRRSRSDGKTRYSYDNPINVRSRPAQGGARVAQPGMQRGRRHMVGEVYLSSRGDAERVLETLSELVEKYNVASVADLYSLIQHPTNYIDNNWGWTELMFANIVQTHDGWLLDLPPVEPI